MSVTPLRFVVHLSLLEPALASGNVELVEQSHENTSLIASNLRNNGSCTLRALVLGIIIRPARKCPFLRLIS